MELKGAFDGLEKTVSRLTTGNVAHLRGALLGMIVNDRLLFCKESTPPSTVVAEMKLKGCPLCGNSPTDPKIRRDNEAYHYVVHKDREFMFRIDADKVKQYLANQGE